MKTINQFIKLFFIFSVSTAIFISCSKDEEKNSSDGNNDEIVGKWKGEYTGFTDDIWEFKSDKKGSYYSDSYDSTYQFTWSTQEQTNDNLYFVDFEGDYKYEKWGKELHYFTCTNLTFSGNWELKIWYTDDLNQYETIGSKME